MPSLVINMGQLQNPWDDVPIEVLIEYERKKREQVKEHREQLRIPLYMPVTPPPAPAHPLDPAPEEDYKIVIDFI